MQLLANTKIDFMKYRKVFVWVSLAFLIAAVVELMALGGINWGIDFIGGTQLTVKTRDAVAVDDLRNALSDAGLRDAQIQQYGPPDAHEVLIKAPVVEGSQEGSASELIAALEAAFNRDNVGELDLNQRGRDSLSDLLLAADPDGKGGDADAATAHYQEVATAVILQRQNQGLFTSFDEVRAVEGVSPAAADAIEAQAFLGSFQVLSNENVGPQIGSELRLKGTLAIVLSLLGMLMYIWYRFELRFGIGALVAVFHDFLITLGLFAIFNYDFSLSTIAAFLTLVGYSVNDTVVIFDRVRENMRRMRRLPLVDVMNVSINQTLSRTILTSGTTLMVVGSLFFAGGEVLRGFAFPLLVGVIVGTYSSIFVASPFALLWEKWFGAEAKARKVSGSQKPQTA